MIALLEKPGNLVGEKKTMYLKEKTKKLWDTWSQISSQ
jgi:hypothetical protein